MNFFLSYNWLKEFVQTRESPEHLARLLSLHGPSVERVTLFRDRWEKMVVGKVVESKKHPNADRLTVNTVDIGGKMVQIICGAPNVRVGMLAAVALPDARVRWHGEGDFVTLTASKIRGVESFGMMCAANEIGLEKMGGEGIVDFSWLQNTEDRPLRSRGRSSQVLPGTPLVEALDMNDTIFDVEVTSNRPDAMSVVGLAREVSAITKVKFLYKEGNSQLTTHNSQLLPFSVTVTEKGLCPRFAGIVIDDIRVGPSPWWMQKRLLMAGLRPINNIVDITNYVMLEQGKPLHAFDAEKLSPHSNGGDEGGVQLIVRRAKKGEKLTALDGKEYELTESMLVIADAEKPIAIAGVMGGEETRVTENTTQIIFESAVFDPVSIRRTARALNLHSEASDLFEKGLSTESVSPALARAVELTLKIAGGHVASKLADVATKQLKPKPITLESTTVKRFLGIDLPPKDVTRILTSLGFIVKAKKVLVTRYSLRVTPPWWRQNDVTMDQDLVEEIGRIYGYHRLPAILPTGELPVQSPEERKEFFWERRVKELLRGAGFTETMSYSFTSEVSLRKLGRDPTQSFRVANPLSDDQSYLRPSSPGSLFEVVATHQGERDQMRIFELTRVFRLGKDALPYEPLRLVGVVVSSESFREAKGVAEFLLACMGIDRGDIVFSSYTNNHDTPWADTAKSIAIRVRGELLGSVVTPTAKALNDFGIKKPIALFRLRFQELVRFASEVKRYTPLPKYPPVLRDLAFAMPRNMQYADVVALLKKNPLVVSVELFDLYQGAQVGEGKKSMAFHLRYAALDRTLTNDEVERVEAGIVKEVEKKFGAKLRDV